MKPKMKNAAVAATLAGLLLVPLPAAAETRSEGAVQLSVEVVGNPVAETAVNVPLSPVTMRRAGHMAQTGLDDPLPAAAAASALGAALSAAALAGYGAERDDEDPNS